MFCSMRMIHNFWPQGMLVFVYKIWLCNANITWSINTQLLFRTIILLTFLLIFLSRCLTLIQYEVQSWSSFWEQVILSGAEMKLVAFYFQVCVYFWRRKTDNLGWCSWRYCQQAFKLVYPSIIGYLIFYWLVGMRISQPWTGSFLLLLPIHIGIVVLTCYIFWN